MEAAHFDIAPCPVGDVKRLRDELGISAVLAQLLVRRGLAEPALARAYLSTDEEHDPEEFSGLKDITAMVLRFVNDGSLITIHGDYDVDGVCSTAVLVRVLRRLGANVDWYLPDRITDGYGLNPRTIERLINRGTALLITADCAITAVQEIAMARAGGMEVLVTDHHAPPADGVLPDAPILHPVICGYPCLDLCATAVAYKLAQGLLKAAGGDPKDLEEDLDLVALATIADIVPLRGENRRLVRDGLRALSATTKPGLRALMAVAHVDPSRLNEHLVGFALGPRVNAAGRLYRADASLELMLTEDAERAAQIAEELDRANQERRHTETRILFEAEAQVTELGEKSAYVLAGDDWHPGVIGIVASRLAERHNRPVILIALEEESGKGSGRSIEAFDLLGALHGCAEHLVRYGGHRAAAGLEVKRVDLESFTAAFVAHAERVLTAEDFVSVAKVDAILAGSELDLELAEELQALAPFGRGNPSASLLLPAAKLTNAQPMGKDKHVRFTVHSGGVRLRGVAFGVGGRLPVEENEPIDGLFTLEVNEWNGVTEPRLKLRHAQPCMPAPVSLVGESDEYLNDVWSALGAPTATPDATDSQNPQSQHKPPKRTVHDRRGGGIAGTLGALVASGESVLVICADARLRSEHIAGRIGGFSLCSYRALECQQQLSGTYTHVVLLDPPACALTRRLALSGAPEQHAYLLWGEAESRFAQRILKRDHDLRPALAVVYQSLRSAGRTQADKLERILRDMTDSEQTEASSAQTRPAALAAVLLRVLKELELIEVDSSAKVVTVCSSKPTSLERSPTFQRHAKRLAEGIEVLGLSETQAA